MRTFSYLTKRQGQVLNFIYTSIKDSGYPPTLAELRDELDVSSNQAILDLLKILENKGFIKKEEGAARGIKILQKGFKSLDKKAVIPLVGISAAGSYTDAFENLEWKTLGNVEVSENVFLVKISGDSMIGVGFNNGDHVMVQKAKEFKNGDIVLARNNDGTTVKTLVNKDGRTYLKPENPTYSNIPIYPETRLIGRVIGKVGKS